MKKVAFYTLGCKVNTYDTEALAEIFEKEGYTIVNFHEKADVYVINTCTVTNLGDRKSRQMIRKAKKINTDAIIVVAGCYAQTAPEELIKIPEVNLVIGNKDRKNIVGLVEKILERKKDKINAVSNIMKEADFEELSVHEMKGKTRAFIKIQEGCNQFCSYCIIPYARGPIRSRKPESVLKEVKKLAESDYNEVVLTGIHVASYGKDLGQGSLLQLMQEIHKIEEIQRIRLSSLEPRLLTEDFLKSLSELDKFCPHFHISLQSGSDRILKAMKRKYTTAEYKQYVKNVRKYFPLASITTDIMVGFPGEGEEEFQETYHFAKEIAFSKIHVFKYSPRKGTPAAKYPNQVKGEIKEERSKKLIALAEKMEREYYKQFIGTTKKILFEQEVPSRNGYYEGLTDNYIRVFAKSSEDIKGQIKSILLEKIWKDHVEGKLI
ncbi:tRNA (N(6)-L-threonylcarbamoyladenosine(37)-C(2))-methylthiotransferase MtaB [Garciella nitratireducens]|uniref:tRNA (N(6)-L-threonylcarbamoyladenosine(37)-C(2))- methylthiotransferase MtaB n=1 Tax=Garciella nitratireducens TaxID=218205 RepID=UPI000DE90BEB|nr:tRNA (N(6)-L-threonylcarbamoyladenosine(37)-C(2))-methylthiotransferase MtaB [Garciella nitratireducens]RBP45491.1 threonylcarbamoyladenosine tRNA methylthiotransferase MtaB [Garciella nitratireducens]